MTSVFEKLICCDLCGSNPENTLQSPCFHLFCKSCLAQNLMDSTLVCPVCKSEQFVPDGDLDKTFNKKVLPIFWLNWHRNYFDQLKTTDDETCEIDGLCEECVVNTKNRNKQIKIKPENCNQKVKECFHCEKKLCELCRNQHYNILRQETFKCLESYQEGSRNLSIVSETLNETRLKKIADYEKLKNDITNKKNEMIKKIEEEEQEIISKLENEIKEDRIKMHQSDHDVKKFNALKEAAKIIREKITSEKDRKVLNEVCQEFLKVQTELKDLLNLECKRIDPKKEKKLVFKEKKIKNDIMGALELKKENLKLKKASIPNNNTSALCTII